MARDRNANCPTAHHRVTKLDDWQIFRIDLDDSDIGFFVRTHYVA